MLQNTGRVFALRVLNSCVHTVQPETSLRILARGYCAGPDSKPVESIGNEKVQKLANEISNLTVLECSWLTEILRKKLNLQKPSFSAMPMPMMGAAPPAAAAAPAEEEAPKEEVKVKTSFDLKLDSYAADSKIKVIKEVRAITNLGLKEAKELVEKAPVVIKPLLTKEDADKLVKTLEGAGAKVSLV